MNRSKGRLNRKENNWPNNTRTRQLGIIFSLHYRYQSLLQDPLSVQMTHDESWWHRRSFDDFKWHTAGLCHCRGSTFGFGRCTPLRVSRDCSSLWWWNVGSDRSPVIGHGGSTWFGWLWRLWSYQATSKWHVLCLRKSSSSFLGYVLLAHYPELL